MKNNMVKKLLTLALAGAMTLSLAACGSKSDDSSNDAQQGGDESGKTYKVAIIKQLDHASLDEIANAVAAELDKIAADNNVTIEYDITSGQNDQTILKQLSDQAIADQVDAIIPIATTAAQISALSAEDTKTPVVYAAVSDPEAASLTGIDYVTGTSDALPVEAQLKLIRALMPNATKIGILHTTSETNSDATLALYKELAPNYGFEIIDKGISTGADLPMALDALLPQVDCTTNLTDNTVVSYLAVVLEKSEEYGKPVFGSEIEQVINGCVASEGIEYTELGRQTGRMAARVLRGESAEDIPYETISNSYLYVNPDALAAYGLTVPAELSERAIDVTAK